MKVSLVSEVASFQFELQPESVVTFGRHSCPQLQNNRQLNEEHAHFSYDEEGLIV